MTYELVGKKNEAWGVLWQFCRQTLQKRTVLPSAISSIGVSSNSSSTAIVKVDLTILTVSSQHLCSAAGLRELARPLAHSLEMADDTFLFAKRNFFNASFTSRGMVTVCD